MLKKEREQVEARHLRKKGLSLNEIVRKLNVSKSSVSTWVRDVRLTKNQIAFLKHKAHLQEIIKKRVETRLRNENERRRKISLQHKKKLKKFKLNNNTLTAIGTMLYWAEGGKSPTNKIFRFSNSDPKMIKIVMCFIRHICKIPDNKIRGHVHLHPHLSSDAAEEYWSSISGIPIAQFHRTSQQHNKRSSNTRDTLPYGTFNIGIYSTDLYLKMLAWIEVINEKVLAKYKIA